MSLSWATPCKAFLRAIHAGELSTAGIECAPVDATLAIIVNDSDFADTRQT
ncbi:hypothetical protein [Chamaesiphon polymorphus]|uniref:hypothetical protein n=1 Tax=Chamaesiphon polymorphus TaxID=2107691 RepID=UPI0015E69FD8|nr:hypothetical protein [Chamaesiphon polymorphus]